METDLVDSLTSQIGHTWISDWLTIDQAMIDAFAAATGDHQFIHVDPARAAATPFGGTVAHGFLTLSLLSRFGMGIDRPLPPGVKMVVNYGLDGVRFVAPVRSGSRVRASFTLKSVQWKRPGQIQETLACAVEVERGEKPVLVATSLRLLFV